MNDDTALREANRLALQVLAGQQGLARSVRHLLIAAWVLVAATLVLIAVEVIR